MFVIAGGPERNGEEDMVEVTQGEQGKRIKMEEETKKISQLLATHLGSAEVVEQPRLD